MNQQDAIKAPELLRHRGLSPTPRRQAVLECLLESPAPLPAAELLQQVRCRREMNKATLYRILDLLVAHELVLRHSAGERSFRYCALSLAAVHDASVHCHFHCTRCGAMQCLECPRLSTDCRRLTREMPMQVQSVEIRLDGLCASCLDPGA